MPPKKEVKEKQVKGDEEPQGEADSQLILQYLKSVNRPYASTDVSANLKNAVPKAAAQRVLQTLADRGDLTVKQYNKQTIFVYNQDNLPVPSPEELAEVDGAHKVTADEVKERKEELRALEKEMSSTAALPKTKDLPLEVEKVTKENALTVSALAPYRKTDSGEAPVEPLTAEEIKVIDLEFVRWHKEWKARKGVYKQIQDHALDMTHQKADEFMEDQGIYPDDEEALEVFSGEFTKPAARPVVPSKRPSTTITTGITQAPSKTAKPSIPVPAKPASTANHKPAPSVAAKIKATTTTSKKRAASKGKGDTLQVEVEGDNADNDASQVSALSQPQPSQATATSQESSAMMQSSSDESASFEEPPKKKGRRG